ncbi:putative integral membrane protein [Gordonia spumicola]|uniref:Putative integral membrane protein n=1 Tax=Gordonia spumicola TaxID=589161 RepID=A0A7I9V4W8_9ACTN|nr:hypothetical protein [Gordonia spumicola]GEE00458.1 putative integral membrane protein [Gordonia spumicola]
MTVGVVAAIVAALAFGTASVMQAHAAARAGADASPIGAMLHPVFIGGMALDAVGFVCTAVASRTLPLFLSQPIISSNLLVTAVLATIVLKVALTRRDRAGIAVAVIALIALGLTSGAEGHDDPGRMLHWALLVGGAALLGGGLLAARARRAALPAALTSGVLFGLMTVAIRIVDGVAPFRLGELLSDPAAYAVVLCGAGGFYLFTAALQTGAVAGAAAAVAVGETVIPGVVGAVLLGDQTRPGWGAVTVVSFIAAIVGAVVVALSDGVAAVE